MGSILSAGCVEVFGSSPATEVGRTVNEAAYVSTVASNFRREVFARWLTVAFQTIICLRGVGWAGRFSSEPSVSLPQSNWRICREIAANAALSPVDRGTTPCARDQRRRLQAAKAPFAFHRPDRAEGDRRAIGDGAPVNSNLSANTSIALGQRHTCFARETGNHRRP